MPHQASDPSKYQFVRLAGYSIDSAADPAGEHLHLPLYVVYWQQVFEVLHALFEREPDRRVVAFYQFCLAGGHLSFLQRPAIRQHCNVDKWPIYMVASAAANQNSLGATLTNIFLEHLQRRLGMGSNEPLDHFFTEVEASYWRQHGRVAQMNQCLPESMRLGEIRHYHTPDGGIQHVPVHDIFSNRLRRSSSAAEAMLPDSDSSAEPEASALNTAENSSGIHEARAVLVNTIVEMGFERTAVDQAMAASKGRPDLAIDLLLDGVGMTICA